MNQRKQDPFSRGNNFSTIVESSTLSNDNQNFLKEVIDGVMTGDTVGWLKLNRLKKLLEDESYRNFLISRLNLNLNKQMSDEQYIEDVVSQFDQNKLSKMFFSDKLFVGWYNASVSSMLILLAYL